MRRSGSGLARSVALLKAFRKEDSDPNTFGKVMAADTVSILSACLGGTVEGASILDVGGASGYVAEALRDAGARSLTVEYDPENMDLGEHSFSGGVRGDGRRLPIASGSLDACYSSNVIEHVAGPALMLEEMVRVTRPGGRSVIAFTNWWSPWGGHETSPWHFLGGERARRHYQHRYGKAPTNVFGRNLFRLSIGEVMRWARSNRDVRQVAAFPRYYPWWCTPIVRVPLLREFVTWNLVLVLEKLPVSRAQGGVPGTPGIDAGRLGS